MQKHPANTHRKATEHTDKKKEKLGQDNRMNRICFFLLSCQTCNPVRKSLRKNSALSAFCVENVKEATEHTKKKQKKTKGSGKWNA